MYDRAQKRGYEEEFDVQAIAREFGENDYMKVLNAGKILEKRGFVMLISMLVRGYTPGLPVKALLLLSKAA